VTKLDALTIDALTALGVDAADLDEMARRDEPTEKAARLLQVVEKAARPTIGKALRGMDARLDALDRALARLG